MRLHTLSQQEVRQAEARRPSVDAEALAAALRRQVDAEVHFDDTYRALYATDASNYRQVPLGVVIPRTVDAVERTVALCREFDAPITSRGAATSLAGQTCNVAVIIDHSKHLKQILGIDPQAKRARVQAGVIHDELDERAKAHNLTFAPDTSTHAWATIGGMVGNNSCGPHSVMGGRTSDNVEEMEILTYDGLRMRVGPTTDADFDRIIAEGGPKAVIYSGIRRLRDAYADEIRNRYPAIPRRVSGYNLDDLLPEKGGNIARALVGSEGTLVTVLEITLRLVYNPPQRVLLVLGYEDIFSACDRICDIMECKPTALEGIDHQLIEYMKRKDIKREDRGMLPEGNGFLMVEFGGETREEAEQKAHACIRARRHDKALRGTKIFDDKDEEHRLWEVRESGLGATAHVPGVHETHPGWEDSAVPPERLGAYLREFKDLLERSGYKDVALYGHFGQGCVHCRLPFDLVTHDGVARYRGFIDAAADLVVKHSGSLSGEHGDGQARAALLEKMFGPDVMRAHQEFKRIWDPRNRMNPGKVIDPYPPTANLRLGADFEPWNPSTNFEFSKDGNTFIGVARRCVGVGKCRRTKDAFMCPSFLATQDELHSTRGRARLLFEMLNSTEFAHSRSWRNPSVLAALDLCLGCKGCKADCPVKVDMAAYKSEFLSHYYGWIRPRSHYSMGLFDLWGRLGAAWPAAANALTHAPVLGQIAKRVAGVSPHRPAPRFAPRSFSREYASRERRHTRSTPGGAHVVLMPDLFHDVFHPRALWSALNALAALGYEVEVPARHIPEARPLLHFGMLKPARAALRRALDILRDDARADTPIICLEPSTVSVFRDEITELLHADEDAARLAKNVVLFSEFLDRERPHLPRLGGRALLHVHCHQKASLDAKACENVLDRMGVETRQPDEGCCGLAGAFGFERGHYDVSMKIGERSLLPAVRACAAGEIIVADGFSCRKQISDGAGKEALHLAQVVELAINRGASVSSGGGNGPSVEPRVQTRHTPTPADRP
jgi:FAD/FMN-containing dehydrogenase/Fe-S oxidoreductase